MTALYLETLLVVQHDNSTHPPSSSSLPLSFTTTTASASTNDNIVLRTHQYRSISQPHLVHPSTNPSTKTMSAIHIHNWATAPPLPTTTPLSPTPSPTTPPSSLPPYHNPHTLPPASTLLPPTALALPASTSKTTSNLTTPILTHQGPDTLPCSSSKKAKKTHRLKNGYIPKGYSLNADGTFSSTDKEAVGTRYHTTETSISTTSEELEEGGTRVVWVRYGFLYSFSIFCFWKGWREC